MKNFNLIMTFVLLAVLICVILRNNIENFQTNQVALNNATLSYGNVPPGTIVSWCHDAEFRAGRLSTDNTANIPDGWVVCDGRTYTKTDNGIGYTPNLVGKFIYGGKGENYANVNPPSNTTGEYNSGNAFGNMYSVNPASMSTTDIMNSGGEDKVTLTESQMPRHRHALTNLKTNTRHGNLFDGQDGQPSELPVGHGGPLDGSVYNFEMFTTYGGGNQAHENMPPYYTLVYIMKKY